MDKFYEGGDEDRKSDSEDQNNITLASEMVGQEENE